MISGSDRVPGVLHQLDGLVVVAVRAPHDYVLEEYAFLQVGDLGEDVIVPVLLDVQTVVLVAHSVHEHGVAGGPPAQDTVASRRG